MSFFQESIKKKYFNELDNEMLGNKYQQFLRYFNNKDIQQNIRNAKEEQFQEGFLRELFVNIFGYTINPQPDFNLTTELKNIANNKKVDGAILKNGNAIAVIELKGTDTSDLDKVESQAFGYKNHNPKCIYVITSNFEKIRFYIQNAVEHINFNLFDITYEQFALMWICLSKENLLNDIPLKMKESSLMQEDNITKKLYADYSKFREAIYTNLVKNNPEQDKLLLFKKTQKLLDRFLFVFFAEDRLLLPPNSIREIINQWKILKDDLDEYIPLYDRFKKFFGYLNNGYKGKNYEVFAYNGGLFAPDIILDNITIDDNILFVNASKLSQYDFDTEVDVNILGHIFEHSLGEIESVQAEITRTMEHTTRQHESPLTTREHAPLLHEDAHTETTTEHTTTELTTTEHAPLLHEDAHTETTRELTTRQDAALLHEDAHTVTTRELTTTEHAPLLHEDAHTVTTTELTTRQHAPLLHEDAHTVTTTEHATTENAALLHEDAHTVTTTEHATTEHAPLLHEDAHTVTTREHTTTELTTREHAPLLQSDSSRISKRKKDGIFYTPKYITKYIVENTVGKLCIEKRAEFGIIDEEFAKGRKNRKGEVISMLDTKLKDYRNWLLNITILDPACGSGAFLNQALDFLINEHQKIDNLRAQLLEEGLVFADITNDILENNIYGVDINEESVDIAKLSLWLRTAQIGRKLNSLSNNIKCGNSLIDDPAIAGDKAFNWEKEFPQVFKEKEIRAFHITLVTHNSRYSQRMFENYVKRGEPVWLSEKEEIIISETFNEIISKDKIKVLAYNICGDHLHFLLVCESQEVPKIVQKIKSITARSCNIAMGRTIPEATTTELTTRQHAPLLHEDAHTVTTTEHTTTEHAPLLHEDAHTVTTTEHTTTELTTRQHAALLHEDAHTVTTTEHATREHAPLLQRTEQRGTTQYHLWAQKYSSTEVRNDEQLINTLEYIRNNRIKHGLPALNKGAENSANNNKGACSLVTTTTIEDAFKPQITGGFDVVIGNPPYGAELNPSEQQYLNNKYQIGSTDTAILFIKQSKLLLNNDGKLSFIIPKSFTFSSNYKKIREYVWDNLNVIIDCRKVWREVLLEQVIIRIENTFSEFYSAGVLKNKEIQEIGKIDKLTAKKFEFFLNGINDIEVEIANKIFDNSIFLNDISMNKRGVILNKFTPNAQYSVIGGNEINRFGIRSIRGYINESIKNDNAIIKENSLLVQGIVAHIENPVDHIKITCCIPNIDINYIADNLNQITIKNTFSNKFIWCLLNSKFLNWYAYRFIYGKSIRTMRFDNPITSRIPIPKIVLDNKNTQLPFIALADKMLEMNKELKEKENKFVELLKADFNIQKISSKLEHWTKLNWAEFEKELKKAKVTLSGEKREDWFERFNRFKSSSQQLKSEIDQSDKKIDQLVYQLYELTEEEIKIVEGV